MTADNYREDLERAVGRIREITPPDLAARFQEHGGFDAPSFISVAPSWTGQVVAIDGSNAMVVEGGSFSVGAIRAVASCFSSGTRAFLAGTGIRLVSIGREERDRDFADLYRECFGCDPITALDDRDRVLAASIFRDTLEYGTATTILEKLNETDVILLDGALRVSHASHDPPISALVRQCARKGIGLAAVTKRTTATWGGGFPLVRSVVALSARLGVSAPWCLRVPDNLLDGTRYREWVHGDTWVGLLHPRAGTAFKMELPRGTTGESALGVFSTLAACSDDGRVTGYPYPLLDAHRHAAITGDTLVQLRQNLIRKLDQSGLNFSDFRDLFGDYHDELERY
jgi:hypothetical protein